MLVSNNENEVTKLNVQGRCACEICAANRDFEIPMELIDDFKKGNVVIFAGAGISTETKLIKSYSFYDEILNDIGKRHADDIGFSDVMSDFCRRRNGRKELLVKIKNRFNHIESFDELYGRATEFHRELSTIHQIQAIVTTNWDDYFENECDATPYVSGQDFALWDIPGRKVFKIHGSINNLGSIIATREDYEKCYDSLSHGVLGSHLKSILSTKTIIYAGYSFTDSDFRRIHDIVTKEMNGFRPHSYIVTLQESGLENFHSMGITPICTSGAHFLRTIKNHLSRDGAMIPDTTFNDIAAILYKLEKIHKKTSDLDLRRYPTAILSGSYQDGLLHALQRTLRKRKSGEYSCGHCVQIKVNLYEEIKRRKIREKNYYDAAYVEGYQNGLTALICSKDLRKFLPFYFIYGLKHQPPNWREFISCLKVATTFHKSAFKWCEKMVKSDRYAPGIVFHHPPTPL